ncbi:MAG TPA: trehalase family glycosidase, partial [Vicinamibacterales bacterium]|nr:trehalase family glycosidase [Vicinamibacterales bacterium]
MTSTLPSVRRLARRLAALAIAVALSGVPFGAAARQSARGSVRDLGPVRDYIKHGWAALTRSNHDLPAAVPDPKFHDHRSGDPWPLYLSPLESRARVETELKQLLRADDLKSIELRTLPPSPQTVAEPGLLYLPRPYVVPGGRFNEMYGWDSYFIQVGLLRDDEVDLARDMVDNFVYEIANYGTILNANRTYYLTRSQPPFLTEMILGVFQRTHDRAWLEGTWPSVERYYRFWTTEPHLIPALGLSRYFDLGEGPAPEVLADERDAAGRTHYDRVREYYRTHEVPDYDVRDFYDRAADRLTALFYKGDRSMRESGFDPSNRFGPFNVDIIHYAPVCLNALLYRMEREAGEIATILGRPDAVEWPARAAARRANIDRYLWDPAAGLYFDYNVETRRRRRYPFATTFYPLWAGAASAQQARRVVAHLAAFEAPGGIVTSTRVTGNQWDAPYGWAPLQMIAIGGLRRYDYGAAADRIARKFIEMVAGDFAAHGTIVEKYDVRRRTSDLRAGIRFGYAANQIGFGWTNGVLLELLAGLSGRTSTPRAPPLAEWVRVG